MSLLTPDQQQGIEAFVDRHFDQLVQWGGDLLTRAEVAVVSGPGAGDVVWAALDNSLSGHRIARTSLRDWEQERFERIGFNPDEQAGGLWVVKPSRYDSAANRGYGEFRQGRDHAFARYDGANWKVVRSDDSPPWEDEGHGWADPSTKLSDTEQAALRRVIQETELRHNVALTIGGGTMVNYGLKQALMRRASASPTHKALIEILVEPSKYDYRQPRGHILGRLESHLCRLGDVDPEYVRSLKPVPAFPAEWSIVDA